MKYKKLLMPTRNMTINLSIIIPVMDYALKVLRGKIIYLFKSVRSATFKNYDTFIA